jgi:tetratricopeptide (TPR) repeat protein
MSAEIDAVIDDIADFTPGETQENSGGEGSVESGQQGGEDQSSRENDVNQDPNKDVSEGAEEGNSTEPQATGEEDAFPENLKDFKELLEREKLDHKAEDFVNQVLSKYSDSKSAIGRKSTEVGLTREKVNDLTRAILSTPDKINQIRETHGLPPIAFDNKSAKDKVTETEEVYQLLTSLQDETKAQEAYQKLLRNFGQRLEDQRLDAKLQERAPQSQSNSDLKQRAESNWASLQKQHEDANDAISALIPFFSSEHGSGVLGSFGVDMYTMQSSPERAEAMYELGKLVMLGQKYSDPKVWDAEIAEKVKAERAKEQETKNKSAGGSNESAGGNPQRKESADGFIEHLLT